MWSDWLFWFNSTELWPGLEGELWPGLEGGLLGVLIVELEELGFDLLFVF